MLEYFIYIFIPLYLVYLWPALKSKIRLLILREGPMRGEIKVLIDEKILNNIINLLGFQLNPLKYYSKADVLVLYSYVEGKPNVLVEPVMCRCTPISINCPIESKEISQNGKNDYLSIVRNPIALAIRNQNAIDRPISPETHSEDAYAFTEEMVFKRYQEALSL